MLENTHQASVDPTNHPYHV